MKIIIIATILVGIIIECKLFADIMAEIYARGGIGYLFEYNV